MLCRAILTQRTTLTRRPRHRAAAEDVQVDVEHRLPGVRVAVENRPVAPIGVTGSFRERRTPSHDLPDKAVIIGSELVEAGDMASRDDQHVRRCLRVDVLEGDDAVVLVDDGCGDLTRDDLAEQAVGHSGLRSSGSRHHRDSGNSRKVGRDLDAPAQRLRHHTKR